MPIILPVVPDRACLECGKDLTDVMGCYIFAGSRRVNGLLCVEHGRAGRNSMTRERYDRLLEEWAGVTDLAAVLAAAALEDDAGVLDAAERYVGRAGRVAP
jgi:hypothetical protein